MSFSWLPSPDEVYLLFRFSVCTDKRPSSSWLKILRKSAMNGSSGAISPAASHTAVVPASFSFARVTMSLPSYPCFRGLLMDEDNMWGILFMCRRCLSQVELLNGYSQLPNGIFRVFREGRVRSSLSFTVLIFKREFHSRRFLQDDDGQEHDLSSDGKENVLQQTSGFVDPLHRHQYFLMTLPVMERIMKETGET